MGKLSRETPPPCEGEPMGAYEKSKPSEFIFSEISQFIQMKFGVILQPVGFFFKLMLNLFCASNIEGINNNNNNNGGFI